MANDDQTPTPEETAYTEANEAFKEYRKSASVPGSNLPSPNTPEGAAEYKRRENAALEKGRAAVAAKQQAALSRVYGDVTKRGGRR